jgi:hypothetical protein
MDNLEKQVKVLEKKIEFQSGKIRRMEKLVRALALCAHDGNIADGNFPNAEVDDALTEMNEPDKERKHG